MVNAKKAAQAMMPMTDVTAERKDDGLTIEHAKWMLAQIIAGELDRPDNNEKAHRWLGYAQGLFVVAGVATMDDLREVNVNAKDE